VAWKATPAGAAQARRGAVGPQAEEDLRGQLTAFLGGYPEGAAVSRQELRNIASDALPAVGQVPVSLDRRLRRRMEGLSGGSTKGRRSSLQLSAQLKRLEHLGLIRRDNERDAVIVTDPASLRRLGDATGEL
jgi:hypothetical protein